MLAEIEIVHVGGGVVRVPVGGFTGTTLIFSWPLSGSYDIRVRGNTIVGLNAWKAKSHEELKRIHRMLSKGLEERLKERRYGV